MIEKELVLNFASPSQHTNLSLEVFKVTKQKSLLISLAVLLKKGPL